MTCSGRKTFLMLFLSTRTTWPWKPVTSSLTTWLPLRLASHTKAFKSSRTAPLVPEFLVTRSSALCSWRRCSGWGSTTEKLVFATLTISGLLFVDSDGTYRSLLGVVAQGMLKFFQETSVVATRLQLTVPCACSRSPRAPSLTYHAVTNFTPNAYFVLSKKAMNGAQTAAAPWLHRLLVPARVWVLSTVLWKTSEFSFASCKTELAHAGRSVSG